jgi:iron complex transport system substrate-binding protein
MTEQESWEFTDDRGRRAAAQRRPGRIVAYIQAGATLWDHGLRPYGIFGSHHDGPGQDAAKAGALPLAEVRSFGSGSALDVDGLIAAAPDLLVAVGYGGDAVYGIDPEAAKHLEDAVPVVLLDVGKERSLDGVRDRFTGLARSLGAEPGAAAQAEAALARAEARLRESAARPGAPRVLALSAADGDTAYLARPGTWPDLRHLADLGVGLIDPEGGAGGNWRTVSWAEAAAYEPDVLLADVRANAAGPAELARSPHWGALAQRCRVLPWNPEAPASHRAHAAWADTVADTLDAGRGVSGT